VTKPGTKDKLLERIPYDDIVICFTDGKFTCHSTREIVRGIVKGNTKNPYTEKQYPEEFIEKMRERYLSTDANIQKFSKEVVEPSEEVLVEPRPRVESRARPPPAVEQPVEPQEAEPEPIREPRKERVRRVRHAPLRSAVASKIQKMGLIGKPFEPIVLFSDTLQIKLKDGSVREVPITNQITDDVVVISLNMDDGKELGFGAIKEAMGKLLPSTKVYIVGFNAKDTNTKNRDTVFDRLKRLKIKGVEVKVKNIFYVNEDTEEDLTDGLVDVVLDIEKLELE
jgi:hypothetical protein